jgi:hypothetical protein
MRLLLDNQPIPCDRPTLAAALDAGRAAAQLRGRVIIEVSLDGQPVTDKALDAPEALDLPDAEVRLISADAGALVRSTLLEVADSMHAARHDQAAAAHALQLGKIEDAFQHIAAALGAWESVREVVVNGAALLNIPLDTLRVRVAPASDGPDPAPTGKPGAELAVAGAVESLTRHLQELKRAMQDRDWTGLADVLAYDMQDLAETWRSILLALAEVAASPPRAQP